MSLMFPGSGKLCVCSVISYATLDTYLLLLNIRVLKGHEIGKAHILLGYCESGICLEERSHVSAKNFMVRYCFRELSC
jgi:hypothetical protein